MYNQINTIAMWMLPMYLFVAMLTLTLKKEE